MITPLLLLAALVQDPAPVEAPPAPPASAASAGAQRAALVPGALPANCDPAAAAAWQALCAAVGATADHPRVRAFELEFEGRARREGASNDFDIESFQYLEPGWVRMTLKSGRVRLRGPAGDYLLDTKRKTTVPLRGKDLANDIRELDDTVRIARSFVALTDPANVRLAALAGGMPPPSLPEKFRERGAALAWLDLTSPDFHARAPGIDGAPEPLYRVRIGCDPATHVPALAVIHEAVEGRMRLETAMLFEFSGYAVLDGYQVPWKVRTFAPDPERSPWVFEERPSLELWLLSGSLAPELAEADFLPPE